MGKTEVLLAHFLTVRDKLSYARIKKTVVVFFGSVIYKTSPLSLDLES